MAHVEAGKAKKGRNFSAEEERSLCRSFLAISQDPICGNGQRNSAFWERITAHFNQNKPRTNPMRPARSLETKWGHIKHDVAKFCGAYKQVFDIRESGTSLDDVVEKSLQFYRDRHPKQQPFLYLHCWQVLKDVPRWWDSPVDVQRRSAAAETGARAVAMAKRKSPPTVATGENGEATGSGSASDDEVAVVSPTGFPRRPSRPQGSKAAKTDLLAQKKGEKILAAQARATETIAEASLRKANALQDQCAMSLFTMPDQDSMTDEAKKYFALRRQEEIHRLERRMQAEKRRAEMEELEHAKLLKERNLEKAATKTTAAATPAAAASPAPVVTAAPPSAPSPTVPNSAAAEPEDGENSEWEDTDCVADTPVEAGESQGDPTFGGSDSLGP
ncbi:hypothetical protein KC19_12G103000 [Ceratodon purpureus]|uniref:No apical meristem-associated C-terminal domain-containing protein n=1 Tax=Ceratodon purpureus TaxID=3225 RepID=A0A8T0G6P1_CERPU|nr:hypothetical protein KC19_12G103000 [Ceratodon purpureus]